MIVDQIFTSIREGHPPLFSSSFATGSDGGGGLSPPTATGPVHLQEELVVTEEQ